MVGRHVEGPHILLDLHAFALRGHQEAGDAARVAVIAGGAGEQHAVGRDMHAGVPHLLAVDPPALAVVGRTAPRRGLHPGRIRAVLGLGQAESDAVSSRDRAVDHRLLLVAAVAVEHHHQRQIADDRMLVLQIVVQAQPLGREMLADHRHPEVGTVLAAVTPSASRNADARPCRRGLGLAQQRLPFLPRQAAILEIGARPFAAMIEETDVVVGVLQRLDLARDEAVEFVEISDQVGRQCKIHGASPFIIVVSND